MADQIGGAATRRLPRAANTLAPPLLTAFLKKQRDVFLQALLRLEREDDLIRKQSLQLGRLIVDFNAERGNIRA